MPMMLDHFVPSPKSQGAGPAQDAQNYYGHRRQQATKCGHMMHPSAPKHTPICPACTISEAKANKDAALRGLIAEGGLFPEDYMRDRRWHTAKLRYEIVGKHQAKVRSRDQLRIEREQIWEEVHERSEPLQAVAAFETPEDCPVCASTMAGQSTTVSKIQAAKDEAWWEGPGALVADHILVRRTPLRPVRPVQARQDAPRPAPSLNLQIRVQKLRKDMAAADAHRRAWEARYRTESAVRRKHGLGEGFHFEPTFWDAPISGYVSLQNHQYAKDHRRMVERRARGNTTRPKLPRSSLSSTALADEVKVNEETLKEMRKKEEAEFLDRTARKVAEEVGYLYFVGGIDGLLYWRDDYLRSDRTLVHRSFVSKPGSAESKSDYAEAGSEDEYESTEEEVDSDEETAESGDETSDDEDGEDCDEMDVEE
jgi:hypothetical protein